MSGLSSLASVDASRVPLAAPAAAVEAEADTLLAAALGCGHRGAPRQALSTALMTYWLWLPRVSANARAGLIPRLREAIRLGETTPRAWVCIALADPDFALVREATLGHLGVGPVSLDRREQAVTEVIDWIRRELPLNRAAAFAALLDLDDEAVLGRLTSLRHRLSRVEAEAVLTTSGQSISEATRQFIEEWQAA